MAPRLEPQERLGAEEAEPADLLAADHALEQERRRRPLDPAERRDRGQAVAGQLAVDRDAAGRPGPAGGIPRRWAGASSWVSIPATLDMGNRNHGH